MTSIAKYGQFRMDTPMSVDRLRKIMAAMTDLRTATYRQISDATAITLRAVPRYVYHLVETGRLELLSAHDPCRALPSIYGMPGFDVEDIAPPEVKERPERQYEMNQRRVEANDWPRGQHAHRSGLLAAFFPLAQG